MIAFTAVITALPAKHVDEEAKRIMQTTKYMCCSLERHTDPLLQIVLSNQPDISRGQALQKRVGRVSHIVLRTEP
jgi:hypothetical protein